MQIIDTSRFIVVLRMDVPRRAHSRIAQLTDAARDTDLKPYRRGGDKPEHISVVLDRVMRTFAPSPPLTPET